MDKKASFWPPFWLTHALYALDWIVAWSDVNWVPHRVTWFFFIIPGAELAALLVLACVKPRFWAGIFVAVLLQAVFYLPQWLFLALYAGLGDNSSFFS